MEQTFELSGINCPRCVARVKKALEPLAEKVVVTLSPATAVLTVERPVSLDEINKALAEVGEYSAKALV